ncbi:NTP pyrophosphohydrolase [Bombiscardovia nodaiensis]|uniref:NTP pyrophosphohydrolase n=1 Tax=Bombiscardovia nodaiensis TaxID=2932181 RepID=A0ABM8B7Q6_9BIFI|nr:NTP pyrophosphohydrolase [Bombiscardovia nodaiensis]
MSEEQHKSKQSLEERFQASEDQVDMSRPAVLLSNRTVYKGAIFSVEDRQIGLAKREGGYIGIRRQMVHHAPCVTMLVHDAAKDQYLLEREYRVGFGGYTYGLPAGFIDPGEEPEIAALRELREETGIVPQSPADCQIELVADCYSSEGMSDELVHVYIVHLQAWKRQQTQFDPDEHVQSAWVTWAELRSLHISASNCIVAIQAEALRRLGA